MRRAIPAAVAAACAIAGCSDDGGSRMTRDEFAARGNAICREYHAGLRKLGTPAKAADIAPYIARALPLLERQVARLGRLRPPSSIQDDFDAYLDAARAARRRAVALRASAARADGTAVEGLLADAARAGGRDDALARRAGLGDCASDG